MQDLTSGGATCPWTDGVVRAPGSRRLQGLGTGDNRSRAGCSTTLAQSFCQDACDYNGVWYLLPRCLRCKGVPCAH